MRLGKRERAEKRAAMARAAMVDASSAVPQHMCRSAWIGKGFPVGKPSPQWGYDDNKARSMHRPSKVRHV